MMFVSLGGGVRLGQAVALATVVSAASRFLSR
jgi:hypothetical protein